MGFGGRGFKSHHWSYVLRPIATLSRREEVALREGGRGRNVLSSQTMQEERPPEIGPGGRSSCEFRCGFLATTQRLQLPRYDSDCPEHRVSTRLRRTSVDLVAASGPGGQIGRA